MKTRLILPVVLLSLILNTVCYGLSGKEKVEIKAKTEIMGLVMEDLIENYFGKKLTVQELYQTAMSGMMFGLDEFSEYLPAEDFELLLSSLSSDMIGIGAVIIKKDDGTFTVLDILKGSSAEKAGIRKGDIIQKINDKPVKGMEIDEFNSIVRNSDTVRLEILRDGKTMNFSPEKTNMHVPTVTVDTFDNLPIQKGKTDVSKARYIRLEMFGDETDKELKEEIKKFKSQGVEKVIFDLRGNVGGYMDVATNICNELVPKGVIFTTKDNSNHTETYSSKLEKVPFSKVVILVDSETASASELFASAMQDSKAATIVGSTTYGKGIVQTVFTLYNGDGLKFTTMEYFRRNGGKIHNIGVKPDVTIEQPKYLDDFVLISNNNTSEQMPQVKSLLKILGYATGNPDNTFDAVTKASVEEFQKKMKLNPTGFPDKETAIALNEEVYRSRYEPIDIELDRAVQELFKNS